MDTGSSRGIKVTGEVLFIKNALRIFYFIFLLPFFTYLNIIK